MVSRKTIEETVPHNDIKEANKKFYGLQVHSLTFQKVDENGESIDGKVYEYTGDHSSFCEGIDEDDLEEVEYVDLD